MPFGSHGIVFEFAWQFPFIRSKFDQTRPTVPAITRFEFQKTLKFDLEVCFNLKRSTCRPNLQRSETPRQSHSMPSKSLVKRLRAIYEVVVTLYEVTLYEVVEKMLKRLKNPFNGKAISRRDGLFCNAADSRDFLD